MKKKVGIIDMGICNIGSVQTLVERLRVECLVINDTRHLGDFTHLILPGIGSFGRGVEHLRKSGFFNGLLELGESGDTNILGICLGMQLLGNGSEEGGTEGLGLVPGFCKHLKKNQSKAISRDKFKIPHMGWNKVKPVKDALIFERQAEDARYYFVHSYVFEPINQSHLLATTNYGGEFASAISNKKVIGVQFHPEKSHYFGRELIRNFVLME